MAAPCGDDGRQPIAAGKCHKPRPIRETIATEGPAIPALNLNHGLVSFLANMAAAKATESRRVWRDGSTREAT
jgi:hypothetical protein